MTTEQLREFAAMAVTAARSKELSEAGSDGDALVATNVVRLSVRQGAKCEVPCDHIPTRSWPLFRAREVLHGVIESIQREQTT